MNPRSKRSKLATQLRMAEAARDKKRAIMRAHPEGTSWHTRAKLEAAGYEQRVMILKQRIRELPAEVTP
jgi:hypothetical protein